MKRIHDFQSFLNEGETNVEPEIKEFFDALGEICEEADLASSYSRYAEQPEAQTFRRNNGGTAGHDPQKDYTYMLDKMAENGWDKTRLDNLFEVHGEKILDLYNGRINGVWNHRAPQYGMECAGVDVFLYYMTDKEQMLSGMDIKEFIDKDKMYDEYWIKFAYGYHKTGYGKLAIEQQFESVNDWYNAGGEIFLDSLYDSDSGLETITLWKTKVEAALQEGYTFNNPEITLDLTPAKTALGDEYTEFRKELEETIKAKMPAMWTPGNRNKTTFPGLEIKGDIIKIDLSAA